MLATVRSMQHVLQWLLLPKESKTTSSSSSSGQRRQQQQALLLDRSVWLPSLKLLAECLLLLPTADMASSSLQLITLLMQQVNADGGLPRTPPPSYTPAPGDRFAAAAAAFEESVAAEDTIAQMLPLTFKSWGLLCITL
jgi:hypothetical protein